MALRIPTEGPHFRSFRSAYAGRVPAPVGCLLMIVLCPIGIVIGLVAFIVSMLRPPRPRVEIPRRAPAGADADAREAALRRLVRAMALDDTFTLEDARQAGTLAAGGATIDELLDDARLRGWIESRADGRWAVTGRGRAEAERN